jgi:hypothetical protein
MTEGSLLAEPKWNEQVVLQLETDALEGLRGGIQVLEAGQTGQLLRRCISDRGGPLFEVEAIAADRGLAGIAIAGDLALGALQVVIGFGNLIRQEAPRASRQARLIRVY